MATHRHWSSTDAPATETAVVAEVAPVAVTPTPTLTHVWVATYKAEYDDPEVRVFLTKSGCVDWKNQIAMDNWDLSDDDEDEDADRDPERYWDYHDDDHFDWERHEIRG